MKAKILTLTIWINSIFHQVSFLNRNLTAWLLQVPQLNRFLLKMLITGKNFVRLWIMPKKMFFLHFMFAGEAWQDFTITMAFPSTHLKRKCQAFLWMNVLQKMSHFCVALMTPSLFHSLAIQQSKRKISLKFLSLRFWQKVQKLELLLLNQRITARFLWLVILNTTQWL